MVTATEVAPLSAEHVFAARTFIKEFRTADKLAAMILSDLKRIPSCPSNGVNVTVYGLSPFNSWLSFGVAAGPVPNKAKLQEFCSILTERLGARYDIPHEVCQGNTSSTRDA